MSGLVIDLFAGGGGASLGLELALGRDVDVAINHDPVAIAVHKLNHPGARHLTASVWDAPPLEVTKGRPVELLWASPDCTHHSRAKGSKPLSRKRRFLADVVVRWAARAQPRIICLENVSEFRDWGPLNADGRPCKKLAGSDFQRWVKALERHGYRVEWRLLSAERYGAPTKRERLFVVARRDGAPITWPEPTHGPGLIPVKTAAEVIDWSLPCPSIFERARPLAEKTQWRIAEGLRRFVLEAEKPFVVEVCVSTAAASMIQTGYGERKGQRARCLDLGQPLGTVVACGQKHALVAAWLAKHYGGVVGQDLERPASTITGKDHHAVCAARIEPEPAARVEKVRAFLTKYYGQGVGQTLHEPAHTLTARHRLGLVTVHGRDYQIADIGMRMLEPHELLKAQFGEHAARYRMDAMKDCPRSTKNKKRVPITKADKVRLIGNSVCPHVARALVEAQMGVAVEVAA